MSMLKSILTDIKNNLYSIDNQKSRELLFTYSFEPDQNLRKLAKITALRIHEKGIKYLKIGLYLSAFEDENAYYFFREARKIFDNIETDEAEQIYKFISSEDVETAIFLLGTDHDDHKETFEAFRKSKEFSEIYANYEKIRKQVLQKNYTSYKSITRLIKIIQDETINSFKENLKNYKIGYSIIENNKRKELVELKEKLKQAKISTINSRLHRFLTKNEIDIFASDEMIDKSIIESKKFAVRESYQNLLKVVEAQKKSGEEIPVQTKKRLAETVQRYNDQLIDINKIEREYKTVASAEDTAYDRNLIAQTKELENVFENKHKELKTEHKANLNFRRAFFETIRTNQIATLFGKGLVRVFATRRDSYNESILWSAFARMEIQEQDYKDCPGIRNCFQLMKKKIMTIDNKTNRMFEHPEHIYQEIEAIQNNVT